MQPVVFSPAWFARHQRALLLLLAMPVIGRELRDVLAIRPHDVGWDRRIVALTPCSYTVANPDGTLTTDCRTHAKYAKRLRTELDPLWRAAHAWDRFVANPLVPALNAGFDTLTVFPDPGDPGATTIDGSPERNAAAGESWAALTGSAGTASFGNNTGLNYATFADWDGSSLWKRLMRPMFLFSTSALPGSAIISAATLSLFGWGTGDTGGNNPTLTVYGCAPASNTTLGAADYASVSGVAFATGIDLASIDTAGYNVFTFNASGIAAIVAGGISKFCTRVTADASGIAPSVVAPFNIGVYHADQTGSANDPKLDVTYTIPVLPLITLLGTAPV